MKSIKKLLAVTLVVAISMTAFIFPSYAITIYQDKPASYYYGDELSHPQTVLGKTATVADDEWDDLGWKYKNGNFVGGTLKNIGTYPTRPGVILVTSSSSSAGIVGHSAIVYDSRTLVESQIIIEDGKIKNGVMLTPNTWNTDPHDDGDPQGSKEFVAVTVKSTLPYQDKEAAEWCYKQLGKPYNANFFNMETENSFYCSQLIWAAFYKKGVGPDLNTPEYDFWKSTTDPQPDYDQVRAEAIGPYEFIPDDAGSYKTVMIYAQNWWGK